ncbi:MAG: PIN domain-containing protein [Promethearchaeota archaeon]
MKKILLDTTFVLPLFGIDVQLPNLPLLRSIWKEEIPGFMFYLSSISLIEVMYKLNREFRLKRDPKILSRYDLILPTILNSNHVELIHSQTNPFVTSKFLKIRNLGHTDLMDCWILGSAVTINSIFLTEDTTLYKVIESHPLLKNTTFWNWKRLCKELL